MIQYDRDVMDLPHLGKHLDGNRAILIEHLIQCDSMQTKETHVTCQSCGSSQPTGQSGWHTVNHILSYTVQNKPYPNRSLQIASHTGAAGFDRTHVLLGRWQAGKQNIPDARIQSIIFNDFNAP